MLYGKVVSDKNVENIHVSNTSAKKFTITDSRGNFKIPARLNDTLRFSSLQHQGKYIVISEYILRLNEVEVVLEEYVNTLDEVTVGKILTGNLNADIQNVEGTAPLNFYDVGIPGYKGKPATQSERRLDEAGDFKPIMLLGALTGSIALNPIINGITGRTKMLKQRVAHERRDKLLNSIKARFSKSLFSIAPLDEELRADFFYFCEMDENFEKHCSGTSDLEIFRFLIEKLKQYKINQASKD